MTTYRFADAAELNAIFDAVYYRGTTDPRANPALLDDPRADAAYFFVMEDRPATGDRIIVGDRVYDGPEDHFSFGLSE